MSSASAPAASAAVRQSSDTLFNSVPICTVNILSQGLMRARLPDYRLTLILHRGSFEPNGASINDRIDRGSGCLPAFDAARARLAQDLQRSMGQAHHNHTVRYLH